MGQVADYIQQIYLTEETNCAEALFRAALTARRENVPNECYRMMSGYSGGVSCEDICGAVLGGVAAISYLINQGDEESFERSKEATVAFVELCRQDFNTINCHDIKTVWRTEERRCFQAVEKMAGILEEILQKYRV